MKLKITTVFLSLLLIFSSCAPTRIAKNINQCSTTSEIRRTFGPPDYIRNNGSAGEIWIYSETWVRSTEGKITVNDNNATWTNPTETKFEKSVQFFIENEKVYRWKTTGHNMEYLTPIGFVLGLGGCALLGILLGNAMY